MADKEKKHGSTEEELANELEGILFDGTQRTETAHEKARELAKSVNTLSFIMQYMRSPEDAFLMGGLPPEFDAMGRYERQVQSDFERRIIKVAALIGGDPDAIRNPETRTKEQHEKLIEIALTEELERLDAFYQTNYMQAIGILAKIKINLPGVTDDATAQLKSFAALYFFALHKEIKPQGKRTLTKDNAAALQLILTKLFSFLAERIPKADKIEIDALRPFFGPFIENDQATAAEVKKNLPRVASNIPTKLDYPLDKLNANVWGLLDESNANDDGYFEFATEKRGSRKEATVLYGINFDKLEELKDLKITKELTAFDKRVYIVVSNLFASNSIMSAGQIARTVFGKDKPTQGDVARVNDSLTKMRIAQIHIDNTQEIEVNKHYPKQVYDGDLLPFERVTAYINNSLCDSAIHVFREPPLTTFARERNQLTTISRKLLDSPISKTDGNLQIDNYLIERISRMKNGNTKTSRKILFETIFERCGIVSRMQRSRAPEKIATYLEYYKKVEFIKGFKQDAAGVTIIL